MSIVIQELSKSYGNQKAVNNISFEVKKGEIAGFIGPNGSGKTTTMKCICGILSFDSGSVRIGGIDVIKDPLAVKKIIGYLPENNPLYPDMYIREFLASSMGYYSLWPFGNHKKEIEKVIEETGLTVEADKKIGQLSKGYRQRVGLAQALLHNPEILILDEPTTGLDPNQIVEIRNLISGLARNKTVLLSTHILQEVEAICDKVVVINKGGIVADNTPGKIRKSEKSPIQMVYIEFSKPVDAVKTLKGIQGVQRVEAVTETEYLIEGISTVDLREVLFTLASEKKWKLLTIQKKEETLEEAFRKLTSNK